MIHFALKIFNSETRKSSMILKILDWNWRIKEKDIFINHSVTDICKIYFFLFINVDRDQILMTCE